MEIGLSLGSNLGDRLAYLKEARKLIAGVPGLCVSAQSSVYETSPVGVRAEFERLQFLNAVLLVETTHDPKTLIAKLKEIEQTMGRTTSAGRNEPRPIDIDMIFAGDLRLEDGDLSIPHPRWSLRRFVVQPLNELRPDLKLPGQEKSVRELLSALPAGQNVILFTAKW